MHRTLSIFCVVPIDVKGYSVSKHEMLHFFLTFCIKLRSFTHLCLKWLALFYELNWKKLCFLRSQAAQHQDRRHHTNIKPKPTSKEMKLLPLLPNVALDLSRLDLRSKETEIWRLREKKWEKSLYFFSFFAAVQKWAHIFIAAGWTENKKSEYRRGGKRETSGRQGGRVIAQQKAIKVPLSSQPWLVYN